MTNCEACAYYSYDEDYECYICEMDLDEDEMLKFLSSTFDACPYYRSGDEYRMNAADFVAITRLRDAKYSTWDWTYGASPPFTERKVQRFPWGKVEVSYDIRQGSVVECHFYGDFFMAGPGKSLTDEVSSCEIYDLEEAMRGVPYTNEALSPVLDRFPLHLLFSGCNPDELKAFLLPGR